MKAKSLRSALIATFTLLLAGAGPAGLLLTPAHADTANQESAGEMIDDTVITAKVKAAFVQDDQVSALRINVTSNKGIVQLSGFANSAQEADRAAVVAREIPGVKQVKNDIRLKPAP